MAIPGLLMVRRKPHSWSSLTGLPSALLMKRSAMRFVFFERGSLVPEKSLPRGLSVASPVREVVAIFFFSLPDFPF